MPEVPNALPFQLVAPDCEATRRGNALRRRRAGSLHGHRVRPGDPPRLPHAGIRHYVGGFLLAALTLGPTGSHAQMDCGERVRVTTAADQDDPTGCAPMSCSLREAVAFANSCRGGHTTVIRLPPGRHALHRTGFDHPPAPLPWTSAPGDSALTITGRVRIEGDGAVISRSLDAPPFRLFDVAPDGWLALVGVRLAGGLGGAEAGGAIHVRESGRLLLDRAEVTGAARLGGAIYAAGAVTIRDAVVRGGQAERGGGLFVAPTGEVRIVRSEFVQNLAVGPTGFGGAIEARGAVTIRETAFSGNAARHGAAISVWRPGRLRIRGGLIAHNAAAESSGALELLDRDEIARVRFDRNAPRDCVFRYVPDRMTRGCPDAARADGPAEIAETSAGQNEASAGHAR